MKNLIIAITLSLVVVPVARADKEAFSYADDPDWAVPTADDNGVGVPQKINPATLISTGGKEKPPQAKKDEVPAILRTGVGRPEKIPPKKQVFEMPKSFKNACGSWPICAPFYKELKACEPTCEPINYRSHDNRHDGGTSCHNSGRAMDVFGIKCSDTGKSYLAINNGRFQDLVRCVQRRGNMVVLFHNKNPRKYGITQAHYDHGHFSIKCHGGKYW